MSVAVNVPEELYRRATEVAAEENTSVDNLFASAFKESLPELERVKERAARGCYQEFIRVMPIFPAVEPARLRPAYDRGGWV